MPDVLHTLDLAFNPFEPAASGPPIGIAISPPQTLKARIRDLIHIRSSTPGPKVVVVTGDYGTGKTCLLRWLHDDLLPGQRIRPFYFDNPGVHFHDLANSLLRIIGRKDFAKFIWELAGPCVSTFEEYVSSENRLPRGSRSDVAGPLQTAIMKAGITSDEETAHCLARIVTDVVRKPYFEYRDFLPSRTGSLLAEVEEAPYLGAILKTLSRGSGAAAIAFLIDEFEEIGLQKRLTRRDAHDYLSTLKRLINLAQKEDNPFWLFLSMTPDAYQTTRELDSALADRLTEHDSVLEVGSLQASDAVALVGSRLDAARPLASRDRTPRGLFPFPDEIPFSPRTRSNPRRLIKACSSAISAADETTRLPFSEGYLKNIEATLVSAESQAARDQ